MKFTLLIFSITISTVCFCQQYDSLKKELSEIYDSDQKYRILLDSLVRKGYEWQHPEIQKIIPVAARQDSVNLARVQQIIDKHGWLGTDKIGARGNETLFVVIQHADSNIITHYFPLLVKSYETGATPGKHYALMLDRILVERGQKQIFGTQIQMQKVNNRFVPFPVEDEKRLNALRKKVGLQPIEKYLEEINK